MEAFRGTVGGMTMTRQSQFLKPCLTGGGVCLSPKNTFSKRSSVVTACARSFCLGKYADESKCWDPKLYASLRIRKSLQEKKSVVTPSFKVRAMSQYENVAPFPRDSKIPSLEHILEASPDSASKQEKPHQRFEALIERIIFDCRFLTLMAVVGSLAGSLLCFFKGSFFVVESFAEYFFATWQGLGTSQVVFLLVEAIDVYLMGTVMLIFGMGLYELFVSTLEVAGEEAEGVRTAARGSNIFGLFHLRERPKWLEIRSIAELKTKLGHVIVMILLVGMFEKSKKVPIHTINDLLCLSASILLASGSLFLLSKLHSNLQE
ncbi:unnamed protein product [Sphagnum balticum]